MTIDIILNILIMTDKQLCIPPLLYTINI